MFRPHMGHHQATLVIWGDHCTVHLALSILRHIVVVVVNLLRRIFSSYLFSGRYTVIYIIHSILISMILFNFVLYTVQ
jgi:hypothetical protein